MRVVLLVLASCCIVSSPSVSSSSRALYCSLALNASLSTLSELIIYTRSRLISLITKELSEDFPIPFCALFTSAPLPNSILMLLVLIWAGA